MSSDNPCDEWSKTVLFENVPPDCYSDLWIFVNNRSSGGGEIKSFREDPINRRAVVVFADQEVASAFLKMGVLNRFGQTITVTKPQETMMKTQETMMKTQETMMKTQETMMKTQETMMKTLEVDDRRRSIRVTNVPADMNREELMLLVEHEKFEGVDDVEVETVKIISGADMARWAVVQLKDEKVAQSLIDKRLLEFSDRTLHISKLDDDQSFVRIDDFPSCTAKDTIDLSSILVTNLKPTDSDSLLKMYFENKRRSGGGSIQAIKRRDLTVGIVTFEEPEAAKRVLSQRAHTLNGTDLKVFPLESIPDSSDPPPSCAIKVSGIQRTHSLDYIKLHFQHRKHGGGKVENVDLDYDNNTAVVTFKTFDDVQRVIGAGSHVINGHHLNVCVLEPSVIPSSISGATDSRIFIAKCLLPSSKLLQLQKFLQPVVNNNSVTWTRLRTSTDGLEAALHFAAAPDYNAIRNHILSKPFLGRMISIEKIPQTASVEVYPVNYGVSEELLRLHFEGVEIPNGDVDVVDVRMISNKQMAIVTFASVDVVPEILAQTHHLQEEDLQVKPYYTFLENTLPYNADQDCPRTQPDLGLNLVDENISLSSLQTNRSLEGSLLIQERGDGGNSLGFDSLDSLQSMAGENVQGASLPHRTKSVKEKITQLKDYQRKFLVAGKFEQEIVQKIKGLRARVNLEAVTFGGTPENIKRAKLIMYEKILQLEKYDLDLSKVLIDLLAKESVRKYLSDVCANNEACMAWGPNPGELYCLGQEEFNKAEKLISETICERNISLEPFQVELIENFKPDAVKRVTENLGRQGGNVRIDSNKFVLTGFGLDKEISAAIQELQVLLRAVVQGKIHIDTPGLQKYFESVSGQAALRGIGAQTGAQTGAIVKFDVGHDRNQMTQTSSIAKTPEAKFVNSIKCLGGVVVTLVKDRIQLQKVDVIVDTTSTKLELENGQVSASLLSDAGPEIRDECKTLKELRIGEIAETGGYKLPCKRVYHGAARAWDSKLSAECIKVLKSLVSNSLKRASVSKFTSIALPAIGTGNLCIPGNVAAKAMLEEVENFSRSDPNTTVRDVRIAIIETNKPVIEAFEKEMQSLLKNDRHWRIPVVRKRIVEPHKVDKNIIVTAFNQASLDNATKQIAVLFKEVSTDWLPDSPGNLEFLENLTDDQAALLEDIQHRHSVEFSLEPPFSTKKLSIRGMPRDVTEAVKDLQKFIESQK